MKKCPLVRRFLLVAAFALATSPLTAFAAGNDDFLNHLRGDYNHLTNYLNDGLARTLGFYATLGWPSDPEVLDLFTGPRFEMGFGAGADLVQLKLGNLKLDALVSDSNVDVPKILPLPFPVWHAKTALLRGLDFGFRATGYPRLERDSISTANRGVGFEIRYQALGGLNLPTVSVNLTWDHMKGDAYFTTHVDQRTDYVDSAGDTYTATVVGDTLYLNAWDVRSFGVKMMVGKAMGYFHPYGAYGIQRNAGTMNSTLRVNVDETTTGPSGGSSTVNEVFTAVTNPPVTQPKFILGFELGNAFRWSNTFETNWKERSFASGFRVQL